MTATQESAHGISRVLPPQLTSPGSPKTIDGGALTEKGQTVDGLAVPSIAVDGCCGPLHQLHQSAGCTEWRPIARGR